MRYGEMQLPCQRRNCRGFDNSCVFSEEGVGLETTANTDSKAVAAFSQGGGFQPLAALECFLRSPRHPVPSLCKAGHGEPQISNVPGNRKGLDRQLGLSSNKNGMERYLSSIFRITPIASGTAPFQEHRML
jgi:hypothetical protein